jgi:hypothetical protein
VPAIAIPHPVGAPDLPENKEEELRMRIIINALELLQSKF